MKIAPLGKARSKFSFLLQELRKSNFTSFAHIKNKKAGLVRRFQSVGV